MALLASVATAVLFLLSGTFQTVLATTVLLGVSIDAICYLSLFVLRRREPKARRPYRAWGYPWTTAAALLIATALAVGVAVSTPASGLDTLLLLAVSYPAFRWVHRRGRGRGEGGARRGGRARDRGVSR